MNRLKKIIQSPPNPSQPYKHFLTEIYRNIQTFAFKVFQECNSWPSRNGAVQMFFLTPNKNMFPKKCVKLDFWLCGSILFLMSS